MALKDGAFGPYQLEKQHQHRGMAHLWLGTNPEGQTVAVRLLLPI